MKGFIFFRYLPGWVHGMSAQFWLLLTKSFVTIMVSSYIRYKNVLVVWNHLPLWDEVEIIDSAEHWKIRCLKESAHIVTRKVYFYPRTGLYFRTCEDGTGWHLIPYRISPRSEFLCQAYKNWHIMWGINLGLNWPPLARGSKFHTIHTPTRSLSFLPLDNGRYGPIGLVVIILYCSSRQLRFPVWYFKGIYRTILSKIT